MAGWTVLADEELIRLAEVREANGAAAKEYESADAHLKKALRGVERGLLGPFEVSGAWGKLTKYDVPDEVKKQYAVSDPQGRFTLTIERVTA